MGFQIHTALVQKTPAPTLNDDSLVDSKSALINQLRAAESAHKLAEPIPVTNPSLSKEHDLPGTTVLVFPSPDLLKSEYPHVSLDTWKIALDRRARHILPKLPVLSIDKPHIPSRNITLLDMWSALEFIEFQFPSHKAVRDGHSISLPCLFMLFLVF